MAERIPELTSERMASAAAEDVVGQFERVLDVCRQINQLSAIGLGLDYLLGQVVQLVSKKLGFAPVSVLLISEAGDMAVLRATTDPQQAMSYPLKAPSLVSSACHTGQPQAAATVRPQVPPAAQAPPAETQLERRVELAVPLRLGQATLGALHLESSQIEAFAPERLLSLQLLAEQIVLAIRNAQLFHTARRHQRMTEALELAGREFAHNLDMRTVPGRLLEHLAAVVPYDHAVVFLRFGPILQAIAFRGFPDELRQSDMYVNMQAEDIFQPALKSRQAATEADIQAVEGWQPPEWLLGRTPAAPEGDHAWLGVPLAAPDRVRGMLSLTRRAPGSLTPEDAMLAAAFAGQAAIALVNADLYDEIKQFNESLELAVNDRTNELNRAYMMLETLDKGKSSFIDIAAHELRTPLSLIQGYTQLLSEMLADNADALSLLDGILDGEKSLLTVVNSMLDVSKIDAQVLKLHREPVQLFLIIGSIQQDFKEALQERHLSLTLEGLEDLPFMEADPSLLRKAFYQIIINAIKFTPDGGAITVSGSLTADGKSVEVVVSDTGIGIDPQSQSLIFEKFYQSGKVALHSTGRTKFKGGGPGLGLAIARGIIGAHGGKIWVQSPGYDEEKLPGSKFFVRLPLG